MDGFKIIYKNSKGSRSLLRAVLLMLLACMMSACIDPGICDDISTSLSLPALNPDYIHCLDSANDKECVIDNFRNGSDKVITFERRVKWSRVSVSDYLTGNIPLGSGLMKGVRPISIVLDTATALSALIFTHISFIHLKDGHK